MTGFTRLVAVALLLVGLGGAAAAHNGKGPESKGPQDFAITTLSNRADLVSGGDVLLEVRVPKQAALDKVVVTRNGVDVTAALRADHAKRTLTGLVTGLRDGKNLIAAGVKTRHRFLWWSWETVQTVEKLEVTNHPRGGPVFTGEQIQPWICATPTPQPGTATVPHTNPSGMSSFATDDKCNIATEYRYWYRRTTTPATCSGITGPNACWHPYDPASPPADVAMTTTDRGLVVPLIVRQERGTINRGIYDIAVLWDPSKPAAEQKAWNGKLQYAFGVASGSPRRQFAPNSPWYGTSIWATNDLALARGFMTAASSLTDHQLNSNLAVAAETLMMIKEHIIEQYGSIRYTMGLGCSGGSIEQNVIASQYPGLIDGLQISCTYPDAITTAMEVGDCVLLDNYFNSPEFAALTAGLSPEQIAAKRAAIAGHRSDQGCVSWVFSFGSNGLVGNIPGLPSVGASIWATTPRAEFPNNCLLPPAMVYDPVTNPGGVRCGPYDHAISIWGNAGDPLFPTRANVPTDNTGVQYGLKALLDGAITAEEFVTLNERIGGFDRNGLPQAERSVADRFALRTAYRSGILGDARSWAKVPIIDLRGNDDDGIHHDWRSFALQARLVAANGHHDNHVLWRFGPGLFPTGAGLRLVLEQFEVMDKWLSNIEADKSNKPIERKVLDNRPPEAYDKCYLSTDTTYSNPITDTAVCDADPVLRYFASPRQVAGGPLTEDVLKCQLKPLDINDYPPGTFTGEQWARLEAVFPNGVCDWSKPGVEQRPAVTNLTYAEGPGGKRLPPTPKSK